MPRHHPPGADVVDRQRLLPLHRAQRAADDLELCRRRAVGVLQERHLDRRRRHAGEGSNLRVRQASFTQRRVDPWQFTEGPRHPQMLARRARIPAHPPRQPARARTRARVGPLIGGIERAQIGQQPMHRSVEMIRLLGDAVAQRLARRPPRTTRVGAPGSVGALVRRRDVLDIKTAPNHPIHSMNISLVAIGVNDNHRTVAFTAWHAAIRRARNRRSGSLPARSSAARYAAIASSVRSSRRSRSARAACHR